MLISYKFCIYPSQTVQNILEEQLELCRWLYNRLLSKVNRAGKVKRC